jgi:hypothetical protein
MGGEWRFVSVRNRVCWFISHIMVVSFSFKIVVFVSVGKDMFWLFLIVENPFVCSGSCSVEGGRG